MTAHSIETEMLGIASKSIEEYDETGKTLQGMAEHEIVKESWKCEDWLAKGLDAYNTVSGADNLLRSAAEQGKVDLTPELQDLIVFTYEAWLLPCEHAEKWIQSLTVKQQRPKNADDLLIAINAARTLIKNRKARRNKIKSVNNAMLRERAKKNVPPHEWFEGKDEC